MTRNNINKFKSYKGYGPFAFTPQEDKLRYNEGNLISTHDDPTFSLDRTGIPITPRHEPCGYWYKDPSSGIPATLYNVYAVGENGQFQLGDDGQVNRNEFTIAIDPVVQQAVSWGNFSWILDKNGFVWAWGVNADYQCTDDDVSEVHVPSKRTDRPAFTVIAACANGVMGVTSSGLCYYAGDNVSGTSGFGYTSANVRNTDGKVPITNIIGCGGGADDLAGVSFLIDINNKLYAAGNGNFWQLGLGDQVDRDVHTHVPVTQSPIKKIECGLYHTVLLYENGEMWVIGRNNRGQCGVGNFDAYITTWTQIPGSWLNMSCNNARHTVAVKNDGTLWATGYGGEGQLGQDSTDDINIFTQIGVATNWTEVATGHDFTVALNSAKEMWGTGANHKGNLGVGDWDDKLVLTKATVDGWDKVVAGKWFVLALREK